MKRFMVIFVLILALFLSGCGQETETINLDETQAVIEASEPIVDEPDTFEPDIDVNIEADVEITSDCGEGIECFGEKFAKCQPGSVTIGLLNTVIYHYEIIGLKNGLCKVKSKFTANPNPDWVGKEMTCEYDYSKDFETAIEDTSNCYGELHDLLTTLPEVHDDEPEPAPEPESQCGACANCKSGEMIYLASNQCVECIFDNNCNDGLKCDRNKRECVACLYDEHCEGEDICFDGQCKSREEIYLDYDCCRATNPNCIECNSQTCENCKYDTYFCRQFGDGDGSAQICIECSDNSGCNDNYICEDFRCVAE